MSPDTATFADCKKLRYCRAGVIAFCERNDLEFNKLLTIGLELTELEKIQDHYVQLLIKVARRRIYGR